MPLRFQHGVATVDGTVRVDDADELVQWLRTHPQGSVDLSGCTHLHAAQLQLFMAAGTPVSAWPEDGQFKSWLMAALARGQESNQGSIPWPRPS
jgi:hypothetical protein